MYFGKVSVLLFFVAIGAASASDNGSQNPQPPPQNASPFDSANQCLLQLQSNACQSTLNTLSILQPQFGNIGPLLSNLLQMMTRPQFLGRRMNVAANGNPIYTTLPFQDSNLTQLISTWNDLTNLKPALPEEEPDKEDLPGMIQLGPRAGSGNRTILADLNFATFSQLFNLVGRR